MLSLLISILLQAALPAKENLTAKEVLQKTSDKLNSAKTMQYSYRREVAYISESIFDTLQAHVFLDHAIADTVVGLRFQIETEGYSDIYNGTEKFVLNKKDRTLQLSIKPGFKAFSSMSAFYNSPLTLRNTISTLLANPLFKPTVIDTLAGQVPCYAIKFALRMQGLAYIKGLLNITDKRDIAYCLLIDKTTFLPVSVYQGNSVNNDYTRTSFAGFELDGKQPEELSWYYTSYAGYVQKTKERLPGIIPWGTMAPAWELISFKDDSKVSLSDYKGKLVVLDFWIKNCGPCIASVPALNELYAKFKDKDFALLGVNAYDPKPMIAVFNKNTSPAYPILYNGEATAKAYGVQAYPMVVVISREGKVIYSGGYEQSMIEKLIRANL